MSPCEEKSEDYHTWDFMNIKKEYKLNKLLQNSKELNGYTQQKAELPYGVPLEEKYKDSLQFFYQKVVGINYMEDMYGYMSIMKKIEVTIWGWTETKVNWTSELIINAKRMGQKLFKNICIATSSSEDPDNFK